MSAQPGSGVLPYRFRDVVRSEWTKAWSVRSTWFTLVLTAAVVIGLAALIAVGVGSHYNGMSPADRATFDPTRVSFYSLDFGQLTLGVLAILLVSSEYSSGLIRTSLQAVPRRSWLLAAKAVVFTLTGVCVGEVLSFTCYLVTQATLKRDLVPSSSLGQAGVLRAVVGAGLYLALTGLGALALAVLVRQTAVAISLMVAIYYVLPEVAGALPPSLRYPIEKYSPSGAGSVIYAVHHDPRLFTAWAGFGVLAAYVAVIIASAFLALAERDA